MTFTGLFVAEGSSDMPLAEHVQALFLERNVSLRLSSPDFALLEKVTKDVKSRIDAGLRLIGDKVDVIVVHRDCDNVDVADRRREIQSAMLELDLDSHVIPVIPVRMTEAWLLLDEQAIRQVAGNPRGRDDLCLPKLSEVERRADPKRILRECLVKAAGVGGRRRDGVEKRFNQHRRQLLERLDRSGPIGALSGWQDLVSCIDEVAQQLQA